MSSAVPLPSRRQASRRARLHDHSVAVRAITPQDFFGWHDAFAACLAETGRRLDETHALRVWQWLEARPPRFEGLVAVVDERIVGLLHFHEIIVPTSGRTEFQLHDLYVIPDMRRRGTADELIGALYAEAERRGAERICTFTAGDDEDSLRYWDRLGSRSGLVSYGMPVQRGA